MYQQIIKKGLSKGLSDIEIYSTHVKAHELSVFKQEVDSNVKSDILSVTIKGVFDNKKVSIRTENLNESKIDIMIDMLISSAKGLTISEPAIIFEGSPTYPEVEDSIFNFDSISLNKKIELLNNIEKLVLENEYVTNVQSTNYYAVDSKTQIINSKGLNLSRHHSFAYAYSLGVFAKDDDIKTAYDIKLVKNFEEFNANEIATATIDKGVAKIGGKSIESKAYPVVFSNEMFSSILAANYSIFTGEAAYRNLTQLKDKVNTKIAVDFLNIIDDPLNDNANFKVPFDDEGVACSQRYLIKNGVFEGFSHNLKTASIFNTNPTGNGFGGSIAPTNLVVSSGDKSFDELIKPIKEGIYITDLVGLHAGVNSVSGDFSLQAGGFKITNGKIDHPVKMIVLSGNFFKMLNQIKGIANDLKFNLSGFGSPSVYIEQLMIGGSN